MSQRMIVSPYFLLYDQLSGLNLHCSCAGFYLFLYYLISRQNLSY